MLLQYHLFVFPIKILHFLGFFTYFKLSIFQPNDYFLGIFPFKKCTRLIRSDDSLNIKGKYQYS